MKINKYLLAMLLFVFSNLIFGLSPNLSSPKIGDTCNYYFTNDTMHQALMIIFSHESVNYAYTIKNNRTNTSFEVKGIGKLQDFGSNGSIGGRDSAFPVNEYISKFGNCWIEITIDSDTKTIATIQASQECSSVLNPLLLLPTIDFLKRKDKK